MAAMTAARVVGDLAGLTVAGAVSLAQPNAGIQPQPNARAFGFRVAVGGYSFTVQVSVAAALLTCFPSGSS